MPNPLPILFPLALMATDLAADGPRCVRTRGDLLKRSDIIAMYQERNTDTIAKYCLDVIAWGGQLGYGEKPLAKRREVIARALSAGVRFNAIDLAAVQEGGRFLVCQGNRDSNHVGLFWRFRKDNEAAFQEAAELGIDLKKHGVVDLDGELVGVPWLLKRWKIPMACLRHPEAREWFRKQMDALVATGANALHVDEPCMSGYALLAKKPGCFCDRCVAGFAAYLRKLPEKVWREAGIESLDGFDYREFIRSHGGKPRSAPLWREYVRYQLFSVRDFLRALCERARKRSGKPMPLSANAHAGSWIKYPTIPLLDFMTTELAHQAKQCTVPHVPVLAYKLGDTFGKPVATTAHGYEWYLMKTDQRPTLVCTWVALAYAMGHHMMIPYRAWVMDPVKGSDTYRAVTDHYACLARFIKQIAPLLDRHETIATTAVVLTAEAVQHRRWPMHRICGELADAHVPFCTALEGNDLLERRVSADDLAGCSTILLADSKHTPETLKIRLRKLADGRPVLPWSGQKLPGSLPRPIHVKGAKGLWVLPRAVPDDASAPVTIHVLNRDYDAKARRMKGKGPFTVVVDEGLFPGRTFRKATLHQPKLLAKLPPDVDPRELDIVQPVEVTHANGKLSLRVPRLDLWGVVELR